MKSNTCSKLSALLKIFSSKMKYHSLIQIQVKNDNIIIEISHLQIKTTEI